MTTRFLFCPICGQRVEVEVPEDFPEVHRLPDHEPLGNAWPGGVRANLCQGVVITVTLDFDFCKQCRGRMSKHPSGLCKPCYCKAEKVTA